MGGERIAWRADREFAAGVRRHRVRAPRIPPLWVGSGPSGLTRQRPDRARSGHRKARRLLSRWGLEAEFTPPWLEQSRANGTRFASQSAVSLGYTQIRHGQSGPWPRYRSPAPPCTPCYFRGCCIAAVTAVSTCDRGTLEPDCDHRVSFPPTSKIGVKAAVVLVHSYGAALVEVWLSGIKRG